MHSLIIALFIGLVAGIIDVIPMMIQKLDKYSCISAFFHWIILGTVIPFVARGIHPVLKGAILGFLLGVSTLVLIFKNKKTEVIPVIIFSLLLGAGVGRAGNYFIG